MPNKNARYYSNAIVNPIYQSATYFFDCTEDVIAYHQGELKTGRYGRYDCPNWLEVEERLAALEGAEAALIFPTGMSAITTALMMYLRPGVKFLYTNEGYRNVRNLSREILSPWGIESVPVSMASPDIAQRIGPKYPKSVFLLETPSNPHMFIGDVEAFKKYMPDSWLIVDSTFASPVNFQPLKFGADLVTHSLTKYISGHADILGGCVCGSRAEIEKLRKYRNITGSVSDAHTAFLLNRSLDTLEMRMAFLNQQGQAFAEFMEKHDKVAKVHYTGLPSHPHHQLGKKFLKGHGSVVTVELKADMKQTSVFVDSLNVPYMGTNFGSTKSMVEQMSIFTYYSLTAAERDSLMISDSLIRFSIGFERLEDLFADVEQAFKKMPDSADVSAALPPRRQACA